jgi:hypothetical protein
MSFVILALLAVVATMWKTASTVMGSVDESRTARAARAAGEPALEFPWREVIVSRKWSEAWAVLVPQSKYGREGSLAAARRPSEARRRWLNISLVAKKMRNVKQSSEKPCDTFAAAGVNECFNCE